MLLIYECGVRFVKLCKISNKQQRHTVPFICSELCVESGTLAKLVLRLSRLDLSVSNNKGNKMLTLTAWTGWIIIVLTFVILLILYHIRMISLKKGMKMHEDDYIYNLIVKQMELWDFGCALTLRTNDGIWPASDVTWEISTIGLKNVQYN